jgi:hypothetical protein
VEYRVESVGGSRKKRRRDIDLICELKALILEPVPQHMAEGCGEHELVLQRMGRGLKQVYYKPNVCEIEANMLCLECKITNLRCKQRQREVDLKKIEKKTKESDKRREEKDYREVWKQPHQSLVHGL